MSDRIRPFLPCSLQVLKSLDSHMHTVHRWWNAKQTVDTFDSTCAMHQINSTNNQQCRKRNDRKASGGRRRRKVEQTERELGWSWSMIMFLTFAVKLLHPCFHGSLYGGFPSCGFVPLFIEAHYFIATRLWIAYSTHAVVEQFFGARSYPNESSRFLFESNERDTLSIIG